eukprot:EG_transcript_6266
MLERADARDKLEVEDEHLLEEEIQEWLETNLEVEITDLFHDLEDGVLLCQLLERCGLKLRYRCSARKLGIFHCRDNVAQFLDKCRQLEALDAVLFNPDDLVEHKNHKQVTSCLFYMAKLLVQYGLKPPTLVRCELEIEALESASPPPDEEPAAPPLPLAPAEPDTTGEQPPPAGSLPAPQDTEAEPTPAESPEQAPTLPLPPAPPPPPVVLPEEDVAEEESVASQPAPVLAPPPAVPPPSFVPTPASKELAAHVDTLLKAHEELRHVTFELVGQGQYVFQDTLMNRTGKVFVREVRGKTIVRVGGGWMSLLKFVMTKFGDAAKLHEAYVSTKENRLRGPKYNSREEVVESNFRTDSFDMVRVPGVHSHAASAHTPERPHRPAAEAAIRTPEACADTGAADEGAVRSTPPAKLSPTVTVDFRHSPPPSPSHRTSPDGHRASKSPAQGRRTSAPLVSPPPKANPSASAATRADTAGSPKPANGGAVAARKSPPQKPSGAAPSPPRPASVGSDLRQRARAPASPSAAKPTAKAASAPAPSPPKAAVRSITPKPSAAGPKLTRTSSASGVLVARPLSATKAAPHGPKSPAQPRGPGVSAVALPPAVQNTPLYF